MKCPVCKSGKLGVVGSVKSFLTINHRYLRCWNCGTTFQTQESIVKESIASQFYMQFEETEEGTEEIKENKVEVTTKKNKNKTNERK